MATKLSRLVRRIMHSRLASASMISSVLLVVAGTAAFASIPDSAGVIHACYDHSGGSLRVIDNSVTNCKSSETAVSWNTTGATGPTGATGAQGLKGDTGATGAAGATGATGATGPQGLKGDTGAQGIKGDTGATGAQGPAGSAGPAGKDGLNGTNGTNGTSVTSVAEPPGANCANGGSAFTSASGTTYACDGINGTNGTNGAMGPAGPAGPSTAGPAGLDVILIGGFGRGAATAVCPADHPYLLGGGGFNASGNGNLSATTPVVGPGGLPAWYVESINPDDPMDARAFCSK